MTTTQRLVHLRKSVSGRYYVDLHVDGEVVKVGWVTKVFGLWNFYATVSDVFTGDALDRCAPTRRDAIANGLSVLRINHGGRIYRLSDDAVTTEAVYVEEADLKAAEREVAQ